MKSKERSEKSKLQTIHCHKCFNYLETNSLRFLIGNAQFLCKSCLKERKPKFTKFKINGYDAYSIYSYDDVFRSTLFALKGCGDIELAKTFLNPYEREISLFFKGYILIPAPSYIDDDLARGFNHVEEIFKSLKLPIKKIFFKKQRIKQSDLNSHQRKEVINNLEVKSDIVLKGQNILIVDDVMTTGSTIKAMITLIEKYQPKKIKILVTSRTELPKKDK